MCVAASTRFGARTDLCRELVGERHSVDEPNEQHDPYVAVPILTERERLEHLGHRLHDAVDLGRPDPYTAGIERGVAAAVDDHAAVHGPRGEVTVRPHLRESLVVRGVIALVTFVGPEAERHRRERLPADELTRDTGCIAKRRAVVGGDVDGQAERGALDLTRVDGAGGVTGHEAAAQVGAARDRREVHVGLHPVVDHVEAVGGQRRARGADRAQRVEAVGVHRLDARLADRVDQLRRDSEERELFGVGDVEQRVRPGMER